MSGDRSPVTQGRLVAKYSLLHGPLPSLSFWTEWSKQGVALFVAQPHALPPRTTAEVWQAFHK